MPVPVPKGTSAPWQAPAAGRLSPSVPLDDLPYVLVRIAESCIYIGLITGEHPDPDRAARVINALLPAKAAEHQTR